MTSKGDKKETEKLVSANQLVCLKSDVRSIEFSKQFIKHQAMGNQSNSK